MRVWTTLVLLLLSVPASAQVAVPVSLSSVSGTPGATVSIAVNVGDLTGKDVMGYQMTVTYDPAVVEIVSTEVGGTMSSGIFLAGNAPSPGEYRVAAIGQAPFQGAGTLVYLRATLLQYGTSPLHFQTFLFDNKNVSATLTDGQVAVVNQPPAFTSNPPTRVRVGQVYSYTPQGADPEGSGVTFSAVSLPAWLSVGAGSPFTITGTPGPADGGVHGVTLRVTDSSGNFSDQDFQITVGTNTAPVARVDSVTVDEDTQALVDVLANDTDPDGDVLTLIRVSVPAQGEAAVAAGNRVSYTPPADYVGADSLVYTVGDGLDTARATVRITIRSVDDAPSSSSIVTPAPDALVDVAGDPADELAVTWRASADPEGAAVQYRWQLSQDAAFTAAERVLELDAGTDTTTSIAYSDLAARLDAHGVLPAQTVQWHHRVVVSDGTTEVEGPAVPIRLMRGALTAAATPDDLPARVVLAPAYPNPFNPSTRLRYGLAAAGQVRLGVYDALGREVGVLVDGWQAAGWHEVTWEAASLPAGAYYCRLRAGETELTQAMLLLK